MRLAQPDAPSASGESVQTDQLGLQGSAFFAARRASWLRPLQLVRALSAARVHASTASCRSAIPGRVDDWRGGGRRKGVAVPGGFRQVPVPHSPPWLRFQSPLIEPDVRISRASGSRTRSCLRPRMARRSRGKAREPVLRPESLVGEAHRLPVSHLVLAAEPLAQPPRGVLVNALIPG